MASVPSINAARLKLWLRLQYHYFESTLTNAKKSEAVKLGERAFFAQHWRAHGL